LAVALAAVTAPAAEFAPGLAAEEQLAVRQALGGGMHAFHAGDYDRAYQELSNAIEAGSDDPRGYYFRGLAALRMGRTSEAEADFASGADREAAGGSMRRVSLALERVQGQDRMSLERYRSRARLAAMARDRDAVMRRYSGIEDAAGDVRRRRQPEDIRPELVPPPAGQPRGAAGAAEELTPPADMPEPKKLRPKSDDPFADEPADEPAAEKTDDAAGEKPMRKSTKAEDDDPFGGN
jgi:tetratricopeptide (TPR) repeat protein